MTTKTNTRVVFETLKKSKKGMTKKELTEVLVTRRGFDYVNELDHTSYNSLFYGDNTRDGFFDKYCVGGKNGRYRLSKRATLD